MHWYERDGDIVEERDLHCIVDILQALKDCKIKYPCDVREYNEIGDDLNGYNS